MFACAALVLVGCSTRETKQALSKAGDLAAQQRYEEANQVLIDAIQARESKIRAGNESSDPALTEALVKKVQSDREILKLERAQIPLYLYLDHADRASAVYFDILAGNPEDHVLYDLLKDKAPAIRIGAVRTLGLTANNDAIKPLIEATKDIDEHVRRAAAAELGTIKNRKTVPALIHLLNDSFWFARSEAADSLAHEDDARAIKPLLDTVSDPNSTVESSAENALVSLCTLPGVSPNDFAAHLDDANPKIVTISAICLAVEKDSRATPVLMKLAAATDVSTRLHAVKGLGETGDPKVIPVLRQTLTDSEPNVRGWSIIGLDKLKDVGSIAALRAMAKDPNQSPLIRKFAGGAVEHLSSQTASSSGK